MRIAFAGTPAFAAIALEALVVAGHEVVLVLTQPDRPSGRGLKLAVSDVKQVAQRLCLPIFQPSSLRTDESQKRLRATGAEVMVVAAYGLILPQVVLDLFPAGCINIHASLLPRWRGAAPIQRALLAGDRDTGISIMRMEAGLDTGPVYLAERVVIDREDTAGSLHDKLAAVGARCIVHVLPQIQDGSLRAQAQPDAGVTYAAKIAKDEAELDWTQSAETLDRRVRAFNPFPGAFTRLNGEPLKIWKGTPEADRNGPAGSVLQADEAGIVVACGSGALRLEVLQRPGGRRLGYKEYLRGVGLVPQERLGA